MTREIWTGIPGGTLASFTGSARYWQAANTVSTFTGAAAPQNIADNYASRVRAYLTAPVTGDYTFWLASDDDGELRISPNDSKFGRVKKWGQKMGSGIAFQKMGSRKWGQVSHFNKTKMGSGIAFQQNTCLWKQNGKSEACQGR